jgi:hypothetical protein
MAENIDWKKLGLGVKDLLVGVVTVAGGATGGAAGAQGGQQAGKGLDKILNMAGVSEKRRPPGRTKRQVRLLHQLWWRNGLTRRTIARRCHRRVRRNPQAQQNRSELQLATSCLRLDGLPKRSRSFCLGRHPRAALCSESWEKEAGFLLLLGSSYRPKRKRHEQRRDIPLEDQDR